MLRDYKILISTASDELAQQVKIILDFLGEPCIVASKKENRIASKQAILAIIIDSALSSKEIDSVAKIFKDVPIILLQQNNKQANLSKDIANRIVSYIPTDFSHAQILSAIHQSQIALENNNNIDNSGKNKPVVLFRSLVGTSDQIKEVRSLIEKVAETDASVLILGESGTGKEVVARNLHYHSKRQGKPFVAINCGAIPSDLLESELFGHEKGAFTGAYSARKGKFEVADGGTIFLDEIGDMPKAMQVKLLRVLQEKTFEKVGGNKEISIDVRVIAATHQILPVEIEKGNFREDLYYRLNVFPINMPPLRDRIEDLPLLINELLARVEGQGRDTTKIEDNAITYMQHYNWPGNVRELANMIERLCIMYPNQIVGTNDLPKKFKQFEKEVLNNTIPV